MRKSQSPRWSELKPADLLSGLRKRFLNPPDEFKPVPWLLFNSKLSQKEVFRSIDLMFEQGIRSFFITPSYGMEIEYLSEKWFSLVKTTVAYCAKKKMTVWIYDDYAWPNGNCGGKLILEYPKFNIKNVLCDNVEVKPGKQLKKDFPGTFLRCSIKNKNGNLQKLQVNHLEEDGINTIKWKNCTEHSLDVMILYYASRKSKIAGGWVANKGCLWQKDNGLSNEYIDWLNPEAIDHFLEMTYERYYEELKPYWENTVKGFMTDEPSILGIHYNEKLHAEFERRYGYKIEDNYEYLFFFYGKDAYKIRTDYYNFTGEMLGRNVKKLNDWCASHGVDFTGHFLGEESLGQEVAYQGDSWNVRKNMSIPGMDLLWLDSNYSPLPLTRYSLNDHFYTREGCALTVKTVTSAARFNDHARVFDEAYGITPYWAGPTDYAAHTQWLTANGINMINDNTLSVSFESFRKRGGGGKHFTMPWWDWYKDFIEFAGRCSLMAALGKTCPSIGMLYPMKSAQCTYNPNFKGHRKDSILHQEINYLCQQTADMLMNCNMAWEVIWEEFLCKGKVKEGAAKIADLKISALVIPGMYAIEEETLQTLESFAASGGTIIFIGILPEFNINGRKSISRLIKKMLKIKNVHFVELHSPDRWDVIKNSVISLLEPYNDSSFKLSGNSIDGMIAIHRTIEDTDVFHFANLNPTPAEITADIFTSKAISLWHPDNGRQYLPKISEIDNGKRICLSFAPWEGYFIVATKNIYPIKESFPKRYFSGSADSGFSGNYLPIAKRPMQVNSNFKSLSDTWEFKTESPNMKSLLPLVLDFQNTKSLSTKSILSASLKLNWQPAPNNRLPFSLDPEKASCFWIRCKFHADHLPDDLAIILDGEDYSEVYCNGRRLENAENTTLWDFSNIKYDLAGTAKKGENILIIKAKISDYFHTRVRVSVIKNIVEPIVLTGSFASRAGKNNEIHLISIPTAVNTGDWGLQGFSGYSGTAIYKQQVDLQKGGNSIYLDLGTVNIGAEVFINGNFAGRHCWPPYHYRIDEFVKDGLNDIELKVKNTLSNLLENYDTFIDCKCGHAPSGILGPVRIVICN